MILLILVTDRIASKTHGEMCESLNRIFEILKTVKIFKDDNHLCCYIEDRNEKSTHFLKIDFAREHSFIFLRFVSNSKIEFSERARLKMLADFEVIFVKLQRSNMLST